MSKKWNASVRIPPTTDVIVRIVGASFGPSNNSGNPMVTVNTEIVTPEEMEIDGEMVTLSGVKARNFFVVKNLKDESKTTEARKNFEELWSKILEIKDPINWDNIDTKKMLGLCVWVFMESEEEERRSDATAAEKAKNPRAEGKILINKRTGKPMVNYWPTIREFQCLAPNSGKTAKVDVAY